jgi:hypothetical protein
MQDAGLPLQRLCSAYGELLVLLRRLYQDCRLVHADLSEYNILVHQVRQGGEEVCRWPGWHMFGPAVWSLQCLGRVVCTAAAVHMLTSSSPVRYPGAGGAGAH